MPDLFSNLIHLRIEYVKKVHDYVQLLLSDESVLNVFNAFSINGNRVDDLSILVGCEITKMSASTDAVSLSFSDGKLLQIGMLDEDYRGPEAMEYVAADGRRVVWS